MTEKRKIIVSTPLDETTVQQLDSFCAKEHLTRAEVLRGLVDALVVEDKQFIFREWREHLFPCGRDGEEMVLAALKTFGCAVKVRRLVAMLNGKVSRAGVFRALNSLVTAGKVEKLPPAVSSYRGAQYRLKQSAA